MPRNAGQKVGNLALHYGGTYAHRLCSAEIAHDREVRAQFYAMMRSPAGKAVREKAIYRVAEGETRPTRMVIRVLRLMKRLGFNEAQREAAIITPVRKFNAALDGRHTGEHRPAA